jgi:hypothetical protein
VSSAVRASEVQCRRTKLVVINMKKRPAWRLPRPGVLVDGGRACATEEVRR